MISASTIYWITRLDNINFVLCFLWITGTLVSILTGIGWCFMFMNEEPELSKLARKVCVRFFLLTVFSMGINIFIPSTKEAAAMIIIPRIANNQQVQDTGKELVELAREWIEQLKPKKESK